MRDETRIRDFDPWLLLTVFSISALGILEIYSATHTNALAGMHWKQMGWVALGLMWFCSISCVMSVFSSLAAFSVSLIAKVNLAQVVDPKGLHSREV